MNASVMSLFPWFQTGLKNFKSFLEATRSFWETAHGQIQTAEGLMNPIMEAPISGVKNSGVFYDPCINTDLLNWIQTNTEWFKNLVDIQKHAVLNNIQTFIRERNADIEFLNLFIDDPVSQEWGIPFSEKDILLDLPGLRLIDISAKGPHKIENYAVVFAPRAGHHSNIAEKTAIYMRDHGLTRMAVVEQKCAKDIPLYIDGKIHREDFNSLVLQFKTILETLKNKTGRPSHLIAVCQPGPLLLSTLILYPDLGKTFGSAGSPMHTEGERGLLTDFARLMGEDYIDVLMDIFSATIPPGYIGQGRKVYDGRLQVLGFYYLGMDQHVKNFRKYYADLKAGNTEAAERQKEFYQWYNWTHHLPAEFIRDTYKKIFVNNDLIRGTLNINGKTVDIRNYPQDVAIWSLGGSKDDIVPPLQANRHLDLIETVAPEDKLSVVADAGHMGIFRSQRILDTFYSQVVRFILEHSDLAADNKTTLSAR